MENINLTAELKDVLEKAGAALVGIGDMTDVAVCGYPTGVCVAVPVPVHIVETLKDGPTKEYYDAYYSLKGRLNEIVVAGAEFLKGRGFDAFARTTDVVRLDKNRRTEIPHKTVATRAGLGWIGKNCLLVTTKYGSAVRLSTLLTDAPLECSRPADESKCGGCTLCVDACPAEALYGTLWNISVERESIVDPAVCEAKQIEIMKSRTGIEQDLCGKCFAVCAYTQKYLSGK